MVGFVHNHPDRPFVMGGMFHGQVGLGGGANNHMRSIQTKSGIKVLMNDDEKSVTILDPSGNTYFMDGNGNISVTAPNDINFNAGANLNISVGQNMTTSVGANISTSAVMNITEGAGINHAITAGGMMMQNAVLDYSLMAANITNFAKENIKKESKNYSKNAEKIEMYASKKDINIKSSKSVNTHSGEKSHNS